MKKLMLTVLGMVGRRPAPRPPAPPCAIISGPYRDEDPDMPFWFCEVWDARDQHVTRIPALSPEGAVECAALHAVVHGLVATHIPGGAL